jgi:hypothetical protein
LKKRKLKLASAPKAADSDDVLLDDESEADVETGAVKGEETPEGAQVPVVAAVSARVQRDPIEVTRRVNRLLFAAILLILALIGIEIWANISPKPPPMPKEGEMPIPEEIAEVLLPKEELRSLFESKAWFRPEGMVTNRMKRDSDAESSALAMYLKTNVKLVGISVIGDSSREAIVVDQQEDKIHFLQSGDNIIVGPKESPWRLKLVRLESDHAVLTDGKEEFSLK